MTLSSSLKIQLRKGRLNDLFSSHYKDLLRAISNDNYEALESLCEETLLVELAAKIYEYKKYKGIQFRIANPEVRDIDVQVINHFYVNNMKINRKLNPSLKAYKMVTKQRDLIEYVNKDEEELVDHFDISVLETLDNLKQYYQATEKEESKNQSNQSNPNETPVQQPSTLDAPNNLREAEERNKFEKSSYVQKQILKSFKEIKEQEYKLIGTYKPQLLSKNYGEFLNEISEKEKTSVRIDKSKLAKDKSEYLESVRDEFHKQSEYVTQPMMVTFKMFMDQEVDKSDMFKFMKIFCPTLYTKYVRINKDQNEDQLPIQTVNQAMSTLSSIKKMDNRLSKRLGRWISSLFSRKKQKDLQQIEVFDVLIKSKLRLQLFHLKSGSEYLCNPSLCDYLQTIQQKFKISEVNDESVYVMDIDKSLYDPSQPEFNQIHCIRFEIDKTKSQGSQGVKITDIDYHLEGNRHAKANSEELYKQQ